jgi:hypothetical protein
MDTKTADVPLKSWIGGPWLRGVPSLRADYEALKFQYPIDDAYFAACEESLRKWRQYWAAFSETVPGRVLAEKKLPDGKDPFDFPILSRYPRGDTEAAQTYNMMICTFGPANFKGIVCLTSKAFSESNSGTDFASAFSAMANSWKETFASKEDPFFIYALPTQGLVPAITAPSAIIGRKTAVPLDNWLDEAGEQDQAGWALSLMIKTVLTKAYP